MDAFVRGRCVASNGPLVYGEVNGAGTGEVAVVPPGDNRLSVTLQTTSELGPVAEYELFVSVDGVLRQKVPLAGMPGFEATLALDNLLAPPDKFVTLEARRTTSGYIAIANPIWLEFPESPESKAP